MGEKKLSKKTLIKSWRYWMMYNLSSMSYERLESFGFCHSMLPIIQELYGDDKEEVKKALSRQSAFYNTEPQLGVVVNGIVAGFEEKRANGESVDDEIINGVKVGMMGPLAGIGDSMLPGMLIPILLSIGMGLSQDGSVLGPIFYIIVFNLIIIFGSYYLFMKGYKLGTNAVNLLIDKRAEKIKEAFAILGVFVTGGIAASYINVTTPLSYKSGSVDINIQNILDGIFPKLLPLTIVLFTYYLMTKKKLSAVKTMLVLLIISIIGVLIGIF